MFKIAKSQPPWNVWPASRLLSIMRAFYAILRGILINANCERPFAPKCGRGGREIEAEGEERV